MINSINVHSFNIITSRRSLLTNTLLLANTKYENQNRNNKYLLNESNQHFNNDIYFKWSN